MFDLVKSHKIIMSIILFLIAVPFAFFGIDFYFQGGDQAGQVAKVGGVPISGREFDLALQQRQEQLRQAMQGRATPEMLNSPEVRQAVLNQLVDDRVTYQAAADAGVSVTASELQQVIASVPAFRENGGSGAFSRQMYEAALRSQGLSEAGFESMLRRDLILNRTRGAVTGSAFVPATVLDRLYRLRGEQREISQVAFEPRDFASKVKIEPAEAQAYYDANQAQFRLPEKVKVEYTLLSLDRVQQQVQITPEQVKQYYDERRAQFETPEERRARHILVSVPASASAEEKAKAKARAEGLLAEAKQAPKRFGEIARKSSEDPGSAAEGGDLGFFPRGRMVKPFDDAVFAAKVGDIVGPVETQFGYHIIQLEEVKAAGEGPGFETVKAQAEAELVKAEAGRRFAEAAETFSNLVYEQPDSLDPVVKEFDLVAQTSNWITREGGAQEDPLLDNQKFLSALFTEDVVKDRRNTEAVEIAPNVLVAARVVEHEAAKDRPFSEVQAEIVQQLTREKAAKLAREAGEARLAQLRGGESAGVAWSRPQLVSREQRGDLAPQAAQAVFSADAAKLPAYSGAQVGDRYLLFRITKVVESTSVDREQRQALGRQIDQAAGIESGSASLESLRKRIDVKINPKAVQPNS
jgi:peptidyl-prolyl cis-trans isomerase D